LQVYNSAFLARTKSLLLLVLTGLAVVVAVAGYARHASRASRTAGAVLTGYAVLGIAFVVVSRSVFDALIATGTRVFIPLAMPVMASVMGGVEAWRRAQSRVVVPAAGCALLAYGAIATGLQYDHSRPLLTRVPPPLADDAALHQVIDAQPPGALVASDAPDAVYEITRHLVLTLPPQRLQREALDNPHLETELTALRDALLARGGVIIYLGTGFGRGMPAPAQLDTDFAPVARWSSLASITVYQPREPA
jgi:hypothetical protein